MNTGIRDFPNSIFGSRLLVRKSSNNLLENFPGETRIVINVGGHKFHTTYSTLRSIPDSYLYELFEQKSDLMSVEHYDPKCKELYFDRDPKAFEVILAYYRTGHLHKPTNYCGPAFARELHEWGIDFMELNLCCWKSFVKYYSKNSDTNTNELQDAVYQPAFQKSIGGKIWRYLFCKKKDHVMRKVRITLNYSVIILLILVLIFTTSSYSRNFQVSSTMCMSINMSKGINSLSVKTKMECSHIKITLKLIDYVSLIYFVPDIVLKYIASPNYILFLAYTDNWINILSTVVTAFLVCKSDLSQDTFLRCINLLRIFSVVRKISRMRIFLKFLRNVSSEMLLMMRIFALLFISTGYIYYCLCIVTHTNLASMVKGFWWSTITLTTVGYGDIIPQHPITIVYTCFCIILGKLILTMPMPLLVKKFGEAVKEID